MYLVLLLRYTTRHCSAAAGAGPERPGVAANTPAAIAASARCRSSVHSACSAPHREFEVSRVVGARHLRRNALSTLPERCFSARKPSTARSGRLARSAAAPLRCREHGVWKLRHQIAAVQNSPRCLGSKTASANALRASSRNHGRVTAASTTNAISTLREQVHVGAHQFGEHGLDGACCQMCSKIASSTGPFGRIASFADGRQGFHHRSPLSFP